MKNIYLGLGSNLEFNGMISIQIFQNAIQELCLSGCNIIKKSNIYSSPAWPVGSEAPDYINMVIEIEFNGNDAFELLQTTQKIEKKFGRKRDKANQWAPRTLDIDILDYKKNCINSCKAGKDLILPHPRISVRDFVFLPLKEIAPLWENPQNNMKIDEIISAFMQDNDIKAKISVLIT